MRLPALVAGLALLVAPMATGATWYVDKACPSPAPDGLTWGTALKTIQSAIDAATDGDEIWVAGGVYDESRADTTGAVIMKIGVALYGGFAGTETQRSERDWSAHPTTISGVTARSGAAAWHTIMGADAAVLDGFTVTGGQASGSGNDANGAGMHNGFTSPTVAHCTFSGNAATGAGGGVYNNQALPVFLECSIANNTAASGAGMHNQASSTQVLDCSFSTNTATQSGGAVSNHGACSPLFLGCTVSGNVAIDGAGIENADACTSTLVRCVFDGNVASNSGGGLANRLGATVTARFCTFSANHAGQGGAASNDAVVAKYASCTFLMNAATVDAGGALWFHDGWPDVAQCSFSVNTAVRGGAVYNANGPLMLANSVFWGNASDNGSGGALYLEGPQTVLTMNTAFCGNQAKNGGQGGAVYVAADAPATFSNDILYGDTPMEFAGATPTVIYSDIQGGHAGTGNIQTDPMYRDGAAGDPALSFGSPCINHGSPDNAPANDILGTPRPQPSGGAFDMGAYEYGTAGPVSDWCAAPRAGVAGLTVAFADLSLPGTGTPMTWLWDFGDGVTSTQQNPVHTYTQGGTYTVSLTVTTPVGANTLLRAGHVVVTGGPRADFTATPSQGTPPLDVQFTDASVPGLTPITGWAWDFGDGTTSTQASPSHTYAVAGVRTVTLTVDSATGSSTKTAIINVGGPTAAFTADVTAGYGSLSVSFTDQSTPGLLPITGYLWDFGDGTGSTSASPGHVYANPGFYSVSMTVTSAVGSTTETKTEYIRVYRRFYVDASSVAASPNGTSWELAFQTIQAGIDAALAAGGPGEVWVAAGAYGETRANATGSLLLKPGVDVYGGFDKSEMTREQRDFQAHVTTIDGSTARAGAPAYHVVVGADNSILDGFTIMGGQADDGLADNGAAEDTGGGMLNYSVSPVVVHCVFTGNRAIEGGGMMNAHGSPTISACTFVNNDCDLDGGGMHNYFAEPTLTNCAFVSNTASLYGGAVYNEMATPVFVGCTFSEHQADYGGAMLNYHSDSLLTDCTFTGNQAACGGAIFTQHAGPALTRCVFSGNSVPSSGGLGGALFNIAEAMPTLDACTFSGNTAESGAGLYNADESVVTLVNCLLVGNTADAAAGAMFNGHSNASIINCTLANNQASMGSGLFNYICPSATTVLNCIFWDLGAEEIYDFDGTATLASYSDIRGTSVYTGAGNINAVPAFIQAPANYRLMGTSPCIDTGINAGAPSRDISGVQRPQGVRTDMGAYEYVVLPTAAFTADTTSGPQPLTVHFTDQSSAGTSPITAWLWDFGDGSPGATIANPAHVYSVGGKHTVTLTVTTTAGNHAITKTDYINVSSGPTADFSATPLSGLAPLVVTFQDLSDPDGSPIVGYLWDFGDGVTSTQQNPSHTFAAGIFTVTLTITAENSAQDTRMNTGYIVVEAMPAASFTVAPSSGYTPLPVQFTDTSAPGTKPITAWLWDFGDGATSTLSNPSHTYTSAGTYGVSLTVTSGVGSHTYTQASAVTIEAGVPPAAVFTGIPLTGSRPFDVQFTDESTPGTSPITAWSWAFGDGATSTVRHPLHTYDTTGDFTVTLTVTSAVGGTTLFKTGYVHVDPGVTPDAAFSASPTSGFRPLTVQFTDQSAPGSSPLTQWTWTFGDGASSTVPSPSHTYTVAGDYTVSLTAANAVGTDTETKTAFIHVGALVYVDMDNTSGNEDGASWVTAYRKIADGVSAASTLGGAEVWVAEGTYNERRSNGSGAVTMAERVHLYGGFAGTETARAQRDWVVHKTTIDGTTSRNGSRAYHVVIGANNATLDGFTITGGNAGTTGSNRDRGAGLYNSGVSPTVIRCTFRDMSANYGGAAIYNESCSPSIMGCLFTNNTAAGVAFSAGCGGAINNQSASPSVANCIFVDNIARASFFTPGRGGAVYNASGGPVFSNCTFCSNSCDASVAAQGQGGAIFNSQTGAIVRNTILWQDAPNEIENQSGGAPQVDFCDVQGGYSAGTGNLAVDPLFTDAGAGDFTLDATSPCIDQGTTSGAPGDDYRGIPRPQGVSTDMGAYEHWTPPVAAFEAAPATGYAPLDVAFTDTSDPGSSPIATRVWDFGDGAMSSETDPHHVFAEAGTYTVSLTVTTAVANHTLTKTGLISVAPAVDPQPGFYADITTGVSPLTVRFTDSSVQGSHPIGAWAWDFGDGASSTEQNPVHVFTEAGSYTVSLTVTALARNVPVVKTDYIVVSPAMAPTPRFSLSPSSGVAPLDVTFTDTSVPGTSSISNWQWDLGDGQVLSGIQNPTHTYTEPGSYTVSLTVVSDSGSPTATVPGAVSVSAPDPLSVSGALGSAFLIAALLAAASSKSKK